MCDVANINNALNAYIEIYDEKEQKTEHYKTSGTIIEN